MHNVSTAVTYPPQFTVTGAPPGLRARMWVAPAPLLIAVAVFTPVAPAEAWSTSAVSTAGLVPLSMRSVIPVGGVQLFVIPPLVKLAVNVATTMAFATVVVMLGVEWVVLLAVACPFSASIGVVVSTPEYAEMEPAMYSEPLPGLNFQS